MCEQTVVWLWDIVVLSCSPRLRSSDCRVSGWSCTDRHHTSLSVDFFILLSSLALIATYSCPLHCSVYHCTQAWIPLKKLSLITCEICFLVLCVSLDSYNSDWVKVDHSAVCHSFIPLNLPREVRPPTMFSSVLLLFSFFLILQEISAPPVFFTDWVMRGN